MISTPVPSFHLVLYSGSSLALLGSIFSWMFIFIVAVGAFIALAIAWEIVVTWILPQALFLFGVPGGSSLSSLSPGARRMVQYQLDRDASDIELGDPGFDQVLAGEISQDFDDD